MTMTNTGRAPDDATGDDEREQTGDGAGTRVALGVGGAGGGMLFFPREALGVDGVVAGAFTLA
jgi:hypothetical protein